MAEPLPSTARNSLAGSTGEAAISVTIEPWLDS